MPNLHIKRTCLILEDIFEKVYFEFLKLIIYQPNLNFIRISVRSRNLINDDTGIKYVTFEMIRFTYISFFIIKFSSQSSFEIYISVNCEYNDSKRHSA